MTKKIAALILVLCMLMALAACSAAEKKASDQTHIILDHLGKEVEVTTDVQRIAVCDIVPLPSVISVFFDSAQKIVGMSPVSMSAAKNSLLSQLYPEILNASTSWITGNEVNIEELMLLEPDVVFYNAASADLGTKLTNAGFAAVAVSVNKWEYDSIETLKNWISLLSEIFPGNDKAEIVSNYSDQVYTMVQSRIIDIPESRRKSALFLYKYDETTILTSGAKFFGQYWADATGMKNVGAELTTDNSVEVSMEQILKWNPDIMFLTNFTSAQPSDILNNSIGNYDWSPIAAVENGKVFKMPLGMYRSYTPGVDTPVTLLWFAKTAYPELFTDINITQETIDYYQKVFGISLTETQAEMIFAPSSAAADGY